MSHPAPAKVQSVFVLSTLILAAAVANMNLAVANVALPDIGAQLGASQAQLNMVAVGFTLGLAGSVLYLGALGDRYGRKLLMILGLALSLPFAALAAWAPSIEVLIGARLLGGVSAGMVYPTTLAIITALFVGKQRVLAIALWSGIGAGASAIGPAIVGWLLTFAWWGAGFAITLPLAAIALVMALFLPRHTGEGADPVDNLGGLLSIVVIGSLVVAITFAPMPGLGMVSLALAGIFIISTILFVMRERHAAHPIFNLSIARRRIFWVAAVAGIIVFGSLMGSFFIGQQFLQNVMAYSTFEAGIAILPSAFMMIAAAPVASTLIQRLGSRLTLMLGFALVAVGFILMFLWQENSPYLLVGTTYAVLGAGVSIAAAPASRSLMASVPSSALGMGSATNDLQRDLGGAIMQSVMGTLLVVRYASDIRSAFDSAPASEQQQLSEQAQAQLQSSFAGAEAVAKNAPSADASALIEAARVAFTDGSNLAFAFALLAVIVGFSLVTFLFPKKDQELALEAQYEAQSSSAPR